MLKDANKKVGQIHDLPLGARILRDVNRVYITSINTIQTARQNSKMTTANYFKGNSAHRNSNFSLL